MNKKINNMFVVLEGKYHIIDTGANFTYCGLDMNKAPGSRKYTTELPPYFALICAKCHKVNMVRKTSA